MNITHLKQLKGLRKNPFIKELRVDLQNSEKKRRQWVKAFDENGQRSVQNTVINTNGEVVAETRLVNIKRVEEKQFAKIYTERIKMIWEMPAPATKVFSYFLAHLKPNQDEIFIMEEDIKEFCDYTSSNPIYKGIKWLIMNEFIAKSYKTNWYYINPTIFFNGDRLIFIEGYYKKNPNENEDERQYLDFNTKKE